MTLRLNGSTSGHVEIDAPAVAGTTSISFPATTGQAIVKAADGSVDLGSVDIDSSGRLLVGTSSLTGGLFGSSSRFVVSQPDAVNVFEITGNTSFGARLDFLKTRATNSNVQTVVQNGDALGVINFGGSDGSSYLAAGRIESVVDGTPGANDMPGRLVFSTTADGASSPTERMRITNAGALSYSPCSGSDLVGNEACGFVGDNIFAPVYKVKSAITSTKNCAIFVNGNGQVGSIQMNGSATSYNTSSDYRLKENVCLVSDSITRLQQLKPSRFNFIADPGQTVDGFIAHEVQSVVPEAITGEKDAVDADGNPIYQGIDQSKLVPLLTAALQEAVAKIESLEARIAALEVTP